MRRNSFVIAGFGLAVAVFLVAAIIGISGFFRVQTVDVTVTGKERVCSYDAEGQDCKYLVFTENETYQNTDNFLRGKFNSSNVQGSIPENGTCTFTVSGYRLPVFSTYQNIIEADCEPK
jgi:hypothetical protein